MTARIIDGKAIAASLRGKVADAVDRLARERGIVPGLAVVLVGNNPASESYVASKVKMTAGSGMRSFDHRLPEATRESDLLALVARLNADPAVHGILVQLPLPKPIDASAVIEAIDPAKDVDGLTTHSAGRLLAGLPGLRPCTPLGIIELLQRSGATIAGAHAVVIGRSEIVGKPTALLLLHRHATVTICHSKTVDLAAVAARADILVAAIGRAGFVTRQFVKPGAVVIDVGVNRVTDPDAARRILASNPQRLADFERRGSVVVGDVHPEVADVAGVLTPVPGGVGPLTIALLLHNVIVAAEARDATR